MMKILAGRFRSRNLESPPETTSTRPIPARVKKSLFDLLRGHTEGASVLDVFAGSGAIGLEAVSRGAARCVFVEKDKRAVQVLERNIESMGAGRECEVVKGDALGPLAVARCPRPVNLIFFDPPYAMISTGDGWDRVRRQFSRVIENLTDDGFAVIRTPWPFLVSPVGAAPEPSAGRGKGRRPGRRPEPEVEVLFPPAGFSGDEDVEIIGEDALEEWAEAEERHPGELDVEGAEGPETHVYGSTALHLYMRRREA